MEKDKEKTLAAMEKKAEQEIIRQYKKVLKEVKSLLSVYYEKHATGDVLTLQEMNRENRLLKLEKQLSGFIDAMSKANNKTLIEGLTAQYAEAYYRAGYGLEIAAQVSLAYGVLHPSVIIEAIQTPIDKLTLNDRMERRRKEITKKVRDGITQGLIQGESYGKMAGRLTGIFEGEARNLTRITRTEGHRIQETATHEADLHAADQGLELDVTWKSTLDKRTRDTHQKLDGKTIKLGEQFESRGHKARFPSDFGVASEDIHCRCKTIKTVAGMSPALERRARNYKDPTYQMKLAKRENQLMAEGYTAKQATKIAEKEIKPPNHVIKYVTYDEWKKTL